MSGFVPGIYRHYKGARYLALFLTEDSNNGPNGEESTQEFQVIYVALDGARAGQKDNRSLKQWNEFVETTDVRSGGTMRVRRFTLEKAT